MVSNVNKNVKNNFYKTDFRVCYIVTNEIKKL